MTDPEPMSGPAADRRIPNERYEVLDVLGQGAMGIVYKARDTHLDRIVAVKTIHPESAAQGADFSAIAARLYQEATAAARLTHPGIVTVYDVSRAAGVPYIVMEFFPGRTLAEIVADGALVPERAVQIVLQICRALEYAHGQGVIHRDIKSSNIMVDDAGHAKLADFGVARVVDRPATEAGRMIGTPAYMAPEQVAGLQADARSDLYSLGIVLYEALTGQRPFPGDDLANVLDRVVHVEPIPARERNFSVPPALDAVVRRAMSKEPDARYPTATAFADALLRALNIEGDVVRRDRRPITRASAVIGAGLIVVAASVVAIGGVPSLARRQPSDGVVFTTTPSFDHADRGQASIPPKPKPTATATGCLSVNAIPFAAVYVDGRYVADTPRACLRIPAGRHRIHFESAGRRSPDHVIVIETHHTKDDPLRVSFDFQQGQFVAR